MSVTQFYNTLTKYWQQIDAFEKHKWKCANDGLLYKEIVEQKIIFKFLLGLNQNLDAVRGQVLAAKPLPNIREVFFEHMRFKDLLLMIIGPAKGDHGVTTAKKLGHTKETCWKLHSKPAYWQPGQKRNYSSISHDRGNLQESTAEVYGTGAIAQKGTFSNALSAKINKKKSWIVDSDASDHMTGDAKVFKSFIPYHGFDFREDDWQC
ncbi:hypothetical protein ACOSQ2_027513 [Xanthoceras sorbifolium]